MKKLLKVLAFFLSVAIIVMLVAFSNALIGNPVSRFLARRAAVKHVEEKYPDSGFVLDPPTFNFKTGGYYVNVSSPDSIDTHFSIAFDMSGRLIYDTYAEYVTGGQNTRVRLENEYRELTDRVFESPLFPYDCDMDYGSLSIYPKADITGPYVFCGTNENGIPEYAMAIEELELDRVYDISAVGSRCGVLIIDVSSETVSVKKAAEVMLGIKKSFDDAGIGFAAMEFTLKYPKGTVKDYFDGAVYIHNFLSSDIYDEGMEERVRQAYDATMAYYDAADSSIKK
ncbi:MAG: hypothetical protein J5744_05045 [Oscillospiraceae bacterium]|nr:hypothetical protein [Oscillospiraceae bacterium]